MLRIRNCFKFTDTFLPEYYELEKKQKILFSSVSFLSFVLFYNFRRLRDYPSRLGFLGQTKPGCVAIFISCSRSSRDRRPAF